jgi:hypothetical protein
MLRLPIAIRALLLSQIAARGAKPSKTAFLATSLIALGCCMRDAIHHAEE